MARHKRPSRLSLALDVLRGRRAAFGKNELLQAAREAINVNKTLMAGYDAGKTGRQRSDWGTSTDVPYYELLSVHKNIRARSRELYKNDSTYRAAINAIVNHVIGTGLRPKPRVVDSNGTPAVTINKQLEDLARRYLTSKDWDAGGRMSFVGEGQRLALKTQLRDGDVVLNAVRARPGKTLSIAWQMVEIDRLDDSKDVFYRSFERSEAIRQVVHGIGLDEYGAPVQYWFRGVENPVAARNVIHSYLQERPEQYIGEPLGTAVLDTVYDKHDLSEDYLLKSRAVAKVLWWLSTMSDNWPFSGDKDSDDFVSLESMSSFRSEEMPKMFQLPDDISKTLDPLMKTAKHDICSGLGLSYITVLLDMSDVNFAAASMNSIKEWINFMTLRHKFVDTFCQPLWEKMVFQAVIDGQLTGVTRDRYLSDPFHYTQCEWVGDPREHADPVKNGTAAINNLKAGRTTLREDLAARGRDYTEHMNELEQQMKDMERVGLSFDGGAADRSAEYRSGAGDDEDSTSE